MPTLPSLALPPPTNWQDFENLCCDLWQRLWEDSETQKNGRGGQRQKGVDIFGRPGGKGTQWAGVQCKLKKGKDCLSRKVIEQAVKEARAFRPPLCQLLIATTASSDVGTQEVAREITEANTRQGIFSLSVISWDDIQRYLASHLDLVARYFPQFYPGTAPYGSAGLFDTARGGFSTLVGEPGPPAPLASLLPKLLSILEGVVEPPVIARAFNRWKPRGPGWPTLPLLGGGGLATAVMRLGAALRQGSDGPFPLLEFVRELSRLSSPETHDQLLSWHDGAAAVLAAGDPAELARLKLGFPAKRRSATSSTYVLVRLAELEPAAMGFRAQAWIYGSEAPERVFDDELTCDHDGFPNLVHDVLDVLDALDIEPSSATLAFMLPFSLLPEAVDQWRGSVELAEEHPIGATHEVHIRSLERMQHPRARRRSRRAWQRWKAMGNDVLALSDFSGGVQGFGPGAQAIWLETGTASGPTIIHSLQASNIYCAVLSCGPSNQSKASTRDLLNVLQAGVPVVLWAREPLGQDLPTARARIAELLGEAPARDLSKRVRNCRLEAAQGGESRHPGHYLALLIDDMEYLPPDQDPASRAIVERA